MKSLRDYIIKEKLHLTKDSELSVDTITVKMPKYDYDSGKMKDEVWRTFEIPNAKYCIFKDYYRGKILHCAETIDMLMGISTAPDDFESFNPEKDIVGHADTIKELIEKYLDILKININMNDYKGLDEDELQDELTRDLDDPNAPAHADSSSFIANVLTGQLKDSDFSFGKEIDISDFYESAKKIINEN